MKKFKKRLLKIVYYVLGYNRRFRRSYASSRKIVDFYRKEEEF